MKTAQSGHLGAHASEGRRRAWSTFWNDPGQSRCVAGAREIRRSLHGHWSRFAASLTPGTRVLDLGCGAGVVACELLSTRRDIHVTGVDYARIPLALDDHMELLADTAMESLPFPDRSFGAVVSQFGIEYADTSAAARELARVLAPGARMSLLVHHAESAIVTTNRERLEALIALLAPMMRVAFVSADPAAFQAQLAALLARHPRDALVADLARSLSTRHSRAQREKQAIWSAIEDALAPERWLAECLNERCVGPDEITQWLQPLRALGPLENVTLLREASGTPIVWKIEGVRSP